VGFLLAACRHSSPFSHWGRCQLSLEPTKFLLQFSSTRPGLVHTQSTVPHTVHCPLPSSPVPAAHCPCPLSAVRCPLPLPLPTHAAQNPHLYIPTFLTFQSRPQNATRAQRELLVPRASLTRSYIHSTLCNHLLALCSHLNPQRLSKQLRPSVSQSRRLEYQ
jgi:hypothetical protein